MSDNSEWTDKLTQNANGELDDSQIEPMAPPGCKLEKKTKKKTTFEKDVGAVHWKKKCSRLTGCDDSYNNTDWVCGDWQRTDDY